MNPVAVGRISPTAPGGRPVNWAASGRSGGASTGEFRSLNLSSNVGDDPTAVLDNRARVAAMVGVSALCTLDAQHGAVVGLVRGAGTAAGTDAVVTTTPGLGLLALPADCVPIVLADPDRRVIAAVHCGWRGLGAGVVPAAVAVMREQGARSICAVTGPAICVDCYPVGPECVEELRQLVHVEVFNALAQERVSQWHVDVRAGVHAQLRAEGVQVTAIARCTATDARLFSHRAEAHTGRQGMIIAL